MMKSIWLFLNYFIVFTINSGVFCDMKDFIIENKNDLKRFGDADEYDPTDAELFYDTDDESLMMYDECAGGGMDGGAEREEVTLEDYMMMSEQNSLLSNVFQDGQINVEMLREAVKNIMQDPRYAEEFRKAAQNSDMYDMENGPGSCQSSSHQNVIEIDLNNELNAGYPEIY